MCDDAAQRELCGMICYQMLLIREPTDLDRTIKRADRDRRGTSARGHQQLNVARVSDAGFMDR